MPQYALQRGFASNIVTSKDYSQAIGTTAVQLYSAIPAGTKYLRVWNVAASGGGTVWLTRSAAVGSGVAANLPGCFALAPGEYELFTLPQAIVSNALWAVATAAGTPLTVEIG